MFYNIPCWFNIGYPIVNPIASWIDCTIRQILSTISSRGIRRKVPTVSPKTACKPSSFQSLFRLYGVCSSSLGTMYQPLDQSSICLKKNSGRFRAITVVMAGSVWPLMAPHTPTITACYLSSCFRLDSRYITSVLPVNALATQKK